MTEFKNKKVAVVGLGKSGVAAARYLISKGACVTALDIKSAQELGGRACELGSLGVELKLGPHDPQVFDGVDIIVISPGVPAGMPAIVRAAGRGVPVIGELELAVREVDRPIVAVTGTNGKTTTTALIGHLLANAGVKACVAGNIGTPLLDVLSEARGADYIVIEVSSFQIETTPSLKPQIGILLNVTPDHLDRHKVFDTYAGCKARLIEAVPDDGWGIYNAADDVVAGRVLSSRCNLIPFDATGRKINGRGASLAAWFGEGDLVVRLSGESKNRYPLANVRLEGIHNRENMLAALVACELCGADSQELLKGIESFKGLAHRVQLVGEHRGIRYYDDSKGTNIGATIRAIESFAEPIVLIAGGLSKGVDFAPLAPFLRRNVKRAVLIGEAAASMEIAFKGFTDTVRAATMDDAVKVSSASAEPGDIVLLSPACASFDMFRDYAHRGDEFAKAVREFARSLDR